MKWIEIRVECYEGYKSRESPRKLITEESTMVIEEILDRWYEGGVQAGAVVLNYYKIRVESGKKYIIRYNSLFDRWSMAV